jgi:hypothetical protein
VPKKMRVEFEVAISREERLRSKRKYSVQLGDEIGSAFDFGNGPRLKPGKYKITIERL